MGFFYLIPSIFSVVKEQFSVKVTLLGNPASVTHCFPPL